MNTNTPYTTYICVCAHVHTHAYKHTKLKYIKAAAIGQSEELLCPILNCLNILQPYSEDTEIKAGRREKRK